MSLKPVTQEPEYFKLGFVAYNMQERCVYVCMYIHM